MQKIREMIKAGYSNTIISSITGDSIQEIQNIRDENTKIVDDSEPIYIEPIVDTENKNPVIYKELNTKNIDTLKSLDLSTSKNKILKIANKILDYMDKSDAEAILVKELKDISSIIKDLEKDKEPDKNSVNVIINNIMAEFKDDV
jgi:hypothetical protein